MEDKSLINREPEQDDVYEVSLLDLLVILIEQMLPLVRYRDTRTFPSELMTVSSSTTTRSSCTLTISV